MFLPSNLCTPSAEHCTELPGVEEGVATSSLDPSLPNRTSETESCKSQPISEADNLLMAFVRPGNPSPPVPPPKDPLLKHSTHPGPAPPSHAHSGPAPLPSNHNSLFPVEDDLLGGDLGALYSAIDDTFDATIRSSDEAAPGLNDVKTTPKSPPRDRRKDLSSTHSGNADSASVPQAPKPFPRARSQTELKPSNGDQSSREVNGHGDNPGSSVRIMSIEELSKNYSQLQLELQELRREVEISRELDG